jgi:hypothetical protein
MYHATVRDRCRGGQFNQRLLAIVVEPSARADPHIVVGW